MRILFSLIAAFLFLSSCSTFKYAKKDPTGKKLHYIEITTDYGKMVVQLFNETPKHRDNMLALAKIKYYDGTMFFRVIKDFMMQGGACDTRDPRPDIALGECDSNYTVPAEFREGIYHRKGALCQARDDNPEKASSATQFYIVQGKVWKESDLDYYAQKRNIKLSPEQKKIYTTVGGTPHLDGAYTVYGQVVEGLNIIDSICNVKTTQKLNDRPVKDIHMSIRVLR